MIARYPNITFCFAHGGGAAPMLTGRFEQGFRTDRPGIDKSLPSPRALLKHLTVDYVTHDTDALHLAETVFGSDHVLFGSDWPFPMGPMKPHSQLAALATSVHNRIFHDNFAPFSA
ncbi:amidohydrolase [Microbacteriaceae bacterium K1510]|nr:amidohydrolase [Microbacteriaceae bacterium K1510]